MTKKKRKSFTREQRDQAVEDYSSGQKSAAEVARELGTDVQNIYRWKTVKEDREKGLRYHELMDEGYDPVAAKKLLEKELELEEYKKKVAEQAIIIDLLKKLRNPSHSAPESELTGLIKTTKKLDRKRGPSK